MERCPRWGIWIDVEGFSNLWLANDLALRGLNELTRIIYAIGCNCFPDKSDRLFAHQVGDGFYIASDFHEPSLDRCAAIAVVLMRCITNVGCVARASIAEGNLADYSGCRPKVIREAAKIGGDSDFVALGSGIMTLQPIMGEGLINAVTLDKAAQTKGALLCVAETADARLSAGLIRRKLDESPTIFAIDWVHSTLPLIDDIANKAGLPMPRASELESRVARYIGDHGLKSPWSDPTRRFVGM